MCNYSDAERCNATEALKERELRINALEAEVAKLATERWWLKNAVMHLLRDADGMDLTHKYMHEQAGKAWVEIVPRDNDVGFNVVDRDGGEPCGDSFPVVVGRDLGKSQSGY